MDFSSHGPLMPCRNEARCKREMSGRTPQDEATRFFNGFGENSNAVFDPVYPNADIRSLH